MKIILILFLIFVGVFTSCKNKPYQIEVTYIDNTIDTLYVESSSKPSLSGNGALYIYDHGIWEIAANYVKSVKNIEEDW